MLIRSAPLEYLSEVAQAFSTFWFPGSTNLANMSSGSIQLLWSVFHFGLMFVFGATLSQAVPFFWQRPVSPSRKLIRLGYPKCA